MDGIRYEADTGWTTFGIFSRAAEYKVKYYPNKPQVSFLSMSGIYLNAILGTVFWLVGIGVFLIGISFRRPVFRRVQEERAAEEVKAGLFFPT